MNAFDSRSAKCSGLFPLAPARLALLRRNFDRIDHEMNKMRVRAAFADPFYSLRGHIDYVRGVMSKKLI